MRIAVIGNIGAGKTTLVTKLAKKMGLNPLFEPVEKLMYLEKFYKEPDKYAFKLQLEMFVEKYTQLTEKTNKKNIISDRILEESFFIFTENLFESGKISVNERQILLQYYLALNKNVPEFDKIIYINRDVDTLMSNINKRGRECENGIEKAYIESLNKLYNGYVNSVIKTMQGDSLIILDNFDCNNDIEIDNLIKRL